MSDQDSNSEPDLPVQSKFVDELLTGLAAYGQRYPEEQTEVQKFCELLEQEPHHRKLKMWLQLGGHSDGDSDTTAVALREAREESGLEVRLLSKAGFDIDVHPIPERKNDPEHFHYDVRYVMQVIGSEDFVISEESMDLAWVPLANITDYTRESTILRMRDKYLSEFPAAT